MHTQGRCGRRAEQVARAQESQGRAELSDLSIVRFRMHHQARGGLQAPWLALIIDPDGAGSSSLARVASLSGILRAMSPSGCTAAKGILGDVVEGV